MIKPLKNILPKQDEIIFILRKNGVLKAGVFGSYARGDNKGKSDIDILVKLEAGKSLLDLAALELELENKLGKKFDLLTYDSIHALLKRRILDEEIQIL